MIGFANKIEMNAIDEIKQRLKRLPELKIEEKGNMITVLSKNSDGFDVWLCEKKTGYTVGFSGWHEEFKSKNEVLNCFAFGLSDEYRLKITKRGGIDCGWTLQNFDGEQWIDESTTGLLIFPFWNKKNFEYRKNKVILKGEQKSAPNH